MHNWIFTDIKPVIVEFSKIILEKKILETFYHFDLLVEREYSWREIKEGIKQHSDNGGVREHVLGQGMKLLFPCVAFFVGDDPQQHRQAGLQEGHSLHGWTYCNY